MEGPATTTLLQGDVPAKMPLKRLLPILALVLGTSPLSAQTGGLVTLGSPAEARLRLDQLLGKEPTHGFLLRTPSTMTEGSSGATGTLRFGLINPELTVAFNSALPFSFNDGALWAGRGAGWPSCSRRYADARAGWELL